MHDLAVFCLNLLATSSCSLRVLATSDQLISRPTARTNRKLRSAAEFASQALYVDVDHIGIAVVAVVPDLLADLRTRDHGTGVTAEVLEQRVFARRERD